MKIESENVRLYNPTSLVTWQHAYQQTKEIYRRECSCLLRLSVCSFLLSRLGGTHRVVPYGPGGEREKVK